MIYNLLMQTLSSAHHVFRCNNRSTAQQDTLKYQFHLIWCLGYLCRSSANNATPKGSI